jgi:hypothetical protein
MKRILNIALVFIFIFPCYVRAQNENPHKLISMIKGDIVDFAVDNLDNVYLLASTDQLKKYNAGGDSVAGIQ